MKINIKIRWQFIYGLLIFVCVFAGTVAFCFDHVTLPGRSGLAEFSGKWAHGAGVLSFFGAAYWGYEIVKEYRTSMLTILSPFLVAAAVSAILLAIKYGY